MKCTKAKAINIPRNHKKVPPQVILFGRIGMSKTFPTKNEETEQNTEMI